MPGAIFQAGGGGGGGTGTQGCPQKIALRAAQG